MTVELADMDSRARGVVCFGCSERLLLLFLHQKYNKGRKSKGNNSSSSSKNQWDEDEEELEEEEELEDERRKMQKAVPGSVGPR